MNILTENQAIERMRALVQRTKAELGITSPPRYMGIYDPIAQRLGIEVIEELLPFDEGQYIPDARIIVLDPRITDPGRLNFTFFHEICHDIVRRDEELYSFLHEYASRDQDFDAALEYYCNIGAGEFLIPADDVHKVIRDHGFRITLIEQLNSSYPASKPAISKQLAYCAAHKCFIVVCEHGQIPLDTRQHDWLDSSHFTRGPQLYVSYSASSPSVAKYRISRYSVISSAHIIARSYQQQQLCRGRALIPFRNNHSWYADCEAFFYKGKVYAAFHASPPPDPTTNQPSLFDSLNDI